MPSGVTKQIGSVTITSRVPQLQAAVSSEMGRRVLTAVQLVRTQSLRTLSGARSGRWYAIPGTKSRYRNAKQAVVKSRKRSDTGRRHLKRYQASAPGEAPAVRLGRLRQSMKAMARVRPAEIVGVVGSASDYSVYLEKGTRKMKPRPFLGPSFEAKRSEVERILGKPMDRI